LGHVRDKRECVVFEMDAGNELKRSTMLTVIEIELGIIWHFEGVMFLDRTKVQDLFSYTTDPMILINDEKAWIS
jgi:hypothetical protein